MESIGVAYNVTSYPIVTLGGIEVKRKRWVILGSILIAILAILTVIGFLFKDDGSLSGFVTEDGQKEYAALMMRR